MKKLFIIALSLATLALLTSGCVVRAHHPGPSAYVHPPRAVVIHTPAPGAGAPLPRAPLPPGL